MKNIELLPLAKELSDQALLGNLSIDEYYRRSPEKLSPGFMELVFADLLDLLEHEPTHLVRNEIGSYANVLVNRRLLEQKASEETLIKARSLLRRRAVSESNVEDEVRRAMALLA